MSENDRGTFDPHKPCSCVQCAVAFGDQADPEHDELLRLRAENAALKTEHETLKTRLNEVRRTVGHFLESDSADDIHLVWENRLRSILSAPRHQTAAAAMLLQLGARVEELEAERDALRELHDLAHVVKNKAESERNEARVEVAAWKAETGADSVEQLRAEVEKRRTARDDRWDDLLKAQRADMRALQIELDGYRFRPDEERERLREELRLCRTKYAQECREEEREACAMVADELERVCPGYGRQLAATIRARSK